jgi:hypothetical protein
MDALCIEGDYPISTLMRGEAPIFRKAVSLFPLGIACTFETAGEPATVVRESWLTVPGLAALAMSILGTLLLALPTRQR